jgi:glutamate racemase
MLTVPASEESAPIGVFDSGVGGLTVAREIVRRLPNERICYVADQLHVPYGGRPLEEIRSFAGSLSHHLFSGGAKVVVMACNISSATALERTRERFGAERVLGVIDYGAKAALRKTKSGKIGVLATQGTVATKAYTRTILGEEKDAAVIEVACPRFVPLVETDQRDGEAAERAAQEYLEPLLSSGTDTVVLGCTHYPFLLPVLEKVAAGRAVFVDPAGATVEALSALLERRNLLSGLRGEAAHRVSTTGELSLFRSQLKIFWPDLSEQNWTADQLKPDLFA